MLITRNRFQYRIVTGRATLPVATIITLIAFACTFKGWLDAVALAAGAFVAYLLIEMNTRFSLIRTRTAFPSSLFLLFYAAIPMLHVGTADCLIPVLFLGMLSMLFKSYESLYASTTIFHAFLYLGLASLIEPYLISLFPVFYFHMIYLRSLSYKTFFAGLIGVGIPYWFLLGYASCTGNIELFSSSVGRLVHFLPIDYGVLSLQAYVSWGAVAVISLVSMVYMLNSSYKDKVQTRIMLYMLAMTEIWVNLLPALQPQHIGAFLPLQIILGAIMTGHSLALTFNRFTHVYCIFVLTVWALLFLFNLWMHFFNF